MGSKGAWIKIRQPISKYPETPQQKRVKIGGFLIKLTCTGKKGQKFTRCRSEVLQCAFDDKKCEGKLLELKRRIEKEMDGTPVSSTG